MIKIKDRIKKYVEKFICINEKANPLILMVIVIATIGKLIFKIGLFEFILEVTLILTFIRFTVNSLIFMVIIDEFKNNQKQIFVTWMYFILTALCSLI
ncbi:hypothetical protein QJR26_04385 [Clostridium baratii]